jgi:hypothetical protein
MDKVKFNKVEKDFKKMEMDQGGKPLRNLTKEYLLKNMVNTHL